MGTGYFQTSSAVFFAHLYFGAHEKHCILPDLVLTKLVHPSSLHRGRGPHLQLLGSIVKSSVVSWEASARYHHLHTWQYYHSNLNLKKLH
jgi:hypothetical protein